MQIMILVFLKILLFFNKNNNYKKGSKGSYKNNYKNNYKTKDNGYKGNQNKSVPAKKSFWQKVKSIFGKNK